MSGATAPRARSRAGAATDAAIVSARSERIARYAPLYSAFQAVSWGPFPYYRPIYLLRDTCPMRPPNVHRRGAPEWTRCERRDGA